MFDQWLESQLDQVRSDLECQNHDYKMLMDQKTHLELEIATYKRLLEGNNIQYVFDITLAAQWVDLIKVKDMLPL